MWKIETEQEMENQRHGDRQAVTLCKRKTRVEHRREGNRNGKSGSLTEIDHLKWKDRQANRQTEMYKVIVGFFHAK